MSKADNKELEEAIKILEDKDCFWNNSEIKVLEAIETVLKELKRLQEENKNSISKDKIREKMVIDNSKLNNCTNYILKNIYKARIDFGQELLEGK